MKTKPLMLVSAFVLMAVTIVQVFSQAEVPSSVLVYIREKQEQGFELINLSLYRRQVFNISADDCYRISPQKTSIAISHPKSTAIKISRLADGETTRNIALGNTLLPCTFEWQNDTHLGLSGEIHSLNPQTDRTIDILSGEVQILDGSVRNIPQSPLIPDVLSDDFRLLSPNGMLAVYNRCRGATHTVNLDGDHVCTSKEEIVIYDLIVRTPIQVLENTNQ